MSMKKPASEAVPSPRRFLLVDDDADHVELMSFVLRDAFAEAEITAVHSIENARALDLTQFDSALVDVNLPDGSGIDLLRHMHEHADVPVILVTGERFGEPAVEGIRAGAADYLVKHGDYLRVLPVVVRKAAAMSAIKAQNRRLEEELRRRNRELERLNEELLKMAAHDPLTGLYNRRHFNELFARLYAESDRYGSDLTCCMMDLDHFKQVNDRFGHQVGDQLLVLTAESLRKSLRAADVAARYGGDEFVVLMPQTSPEDARQSARRIRVNFRNLIAERIPYASHVTLSIGVASRERHEPRSADALLRLADDALYQAKASGRDRIMVVRPFEVEA
ncbi:MAG: diguanylate cyclase [Phycisphaerae bacterium]|nr:diguanylate cyclase [Phycisphaerae bacterium]NUQ46701.1 diguanylate cyclase [Phycisphaerae bacterium]